MKDLQLVGVFVYWLTSSIAEGHACAPGKFGWRCKFMCACQRGSCDQTTGRCESGCQEGRHGTSCQLDSHCLYDSKGRNYTGTVGVTRSGKQCLNWSDPFVQKQGYSLASFPPGDSPDSYCRNPWYRHGHASTPWCFISTSGDRPFDACDIKTCECPDGLFGPNCMSVCHCRGVDEVCDKVTGSCRSGCADGWIGLNCQNKCLDGLFGPNCLSVCHCRDVDEICHKVTGSCRSGCADGWTGLNCQNKCPRGMYGRNCVSECGKCRDGETCHRQTGVCYSGCADGYTGDNCGDKCPRGRYGWKCLKECAYCRRGTSCDPVTGECLIGCEAGKMGLRCDQDCSDGLYGENCSYSCGQCMEECLSTNGHCVGGCKKGSNGQWCTSFPVHHETTSSSTGRITTCITILLIITYWGADEVVMRPEPEGQDVGVGQDRILTTTCSFIPGSRYQPSPIFRDSQDLPRVFSSIEQIDIFGTTSDCTPVQQPRECHVPEGSLSHDEQVNDWLHPPRKNCPNDNCSTQQHVAGTHKPEIHEDMQDTDVVPSEATPDEDNRNSSPQEADVPGVPPPRRRLTERPSMQTTSSWLDSRNVEHVRLNDTGTRNPSSQTGAETLKHPDSELWTEHLGFNLRLDIGDMQPLLEAVRSEGSTAGLDDEANQKTPCYQASVSLTLDARRPVQPPARCPATLPRQKPYYVNFGGMFSDN